MSAPTATGLHSLFCDSIEEFERVLAISSIAGTLGFRLRIPGLHSRFGVPLDEMKHFERIVGAVRKLPGNVRLGFHFHMPSWAIGFGRWLELLESALFWGRTIGLAAHTAVRTIDMGGGFFPGDLDRIDFTSVQKLVSSLLPEVDAIYFEPGRSLTQESEALFSRVLDVRRTEEGEPIEIVVDACIAELPLCHAFPHRMFLRGEDGVCRVLKQGKGRILGRICMEDDILGHAVALPRNVRIGDLVVFGDAGGYERSMSYEFGRG